MYNNIAIADLNKVEKGNLKEELKMSIMSLSLSLGGFSVNFSINQMKRKKSPEEIRRSIEHDIALNKIEVERQNRLAEIRLNSGIY